MSDTTAHILRPSQLHGHMTVKRWQRLSSPPASTIRIHSNRSRYTCEAGRARCDQTVDLDVCTWRGPRDATLPRDVGEHGRNECGRATRAHPQTRTPSPHQNSSWNPKHCLLLEQSRVSLSPWTGSFTLDRCSLARLDSPRRPSFDTRSASERISRTSRGPQEACPADTLGSAAVRSPLRRSGLSILSGSSLAGGVVRESR